MHRLGVCKETKEGVGLPGYISNITIIYRPSY